MRKNLPKIEIVDALSLSFDSGSEKEDNSKQLEVYQSSKAMTPRGKMSNSMALIK